jgi:DNA-binding CsgD family transcriptional regulator
VGFRVGIERLALPLISRIYDAASEASQWQAFVEDLSEAYGGAPVGFAFQLPGFPVQSAFIEYGLRHPDPSYLDVFVEHHKRGLPWSVGYVRNFIGRFGLANEVFPDSMVAETAYYHDFMKPLGLAASGPIGHTVSVEEGRPSAVIALFRREGERPWRSKDCALGDLLVPHLARAYALHQRGHQNAALAEALDRLPTGVMLLDPRGQVILRNRSADRILELEDGLMIHEGQPRAVRPPDNAVLQQMIRQMVDASAGGRPTEGGVMAVTRPSGRRAFPLMLAPLLSAGAGHTLHDAVAVLYVSDVEGQTLQRSDPLRKLYGLTQAEVELVELLCNGLSLEDAASQRNVTMNTARSQLKQIFFKTGTSRQSELLRLVLTGIARIHDAQPPGGGNGNREGET